MNVLDLFSGIGGFSLGLERAGMKTIAFCEKDKFCQKVLKKHWPDVPVFDDITKLSGLVLDENDGMCYNKLCEVNDNEIQIFKTLDEQNKLKKINELIASAKIVGNKCPYLQAWLLEVGNIVLQNADILTCEENLHQTQMVDFGCEVQEILTGKVVLETKDGKDIKRQKLRNGEEEFLQETCIPAKNVESNQKETINCEPIISNFGVNTQKVDLNCLMEKLYAKSATISCTKKQGTIDFISAGIPCQPASVAGKRRGTKDDRWLWGEAYRIIREAKPRWVLLENVKGLLSLEQGVVFENLLLELESYGYETESFIIPACAVNAPHRRDRIWIIANAAGKRCYNRANNRQERYILRDKNWDAKKSKSERKRRKCGIGEINTDVANTRYIGQEKPELETMGSEQLCINDSDSEETKCEQSGNAWTGGEGFTNNISWNENWIEVATRLCGMDARIPNRLDRLKSLGNSVVPQIVEIIGRKILSIK